MNTANYPLQEEFLEADADVVKPGNASAGQLLREARQARGMDVALLASMLKMSVSKLQALEEDRYDLLPDLSFTRSLAIAVCRRLGIDEMPVLDALPELDGPQTVLMPMQEFERKQHKIVIISEPGAKRRSHLWWWLWVLLIALAVLYFMPAKWYEPLFSRMNVAANGGVATADITVSAMNNTGNQAAQMVDLPQSAMRGLLTVPGGDHPIALADAHASSDVTVVQSIGVDQAAAFFPGDASQLEVNGGGGAVDPQLSNTGDSGLTGLHGGMRQGREDVANIPEQTVPNPVQDPILNHAQELRFDATAESWISVKTRTGETLEARLLPAGGSLVLPLDVSADRLPLSVTVGNMQETTVTVRRVSFNMRPYARDNVARFEVK